MASSSQVERHACEDHGRTGPMARPRVVVVGAGVSGCACAAVLAGRGADVTVLNSVLDAVGLPGYGPDLVGGSGGWAEIGATMEALPSVLRRAWLDAASVPEDGAPLLTVDRRAVSIETKRALERIPGLWFRQGLVTDIRMVPIESRFAYDLARARVEVETVFGEVIEADAVVLAVGLALGGHVTVGSTVLPGGRYGEVPADGLRQALEAMGVTFREATLEVGARFSGSTPTLKEALTDPRCGRVACATRPAREVLAAPRGKWAAGGLPGLEDARQALLGWRRSGEGDGRADVETGLDTESNSKWPESYPPAAHRTESLRAAEIVLDEAGSGVVVPLLSPDGSATAEFHLSPDGARIAGLEGKGVIEGSGERSSGGSRKGPGVATRGLASAMGVPASRRAHTVRACVVASLDTDGRLALDSHGEPRIWVVGRAAGAAGYLQSLRSGAVVAERVAADLTGPGRLRRRAAGPAGDAPGLTRRSDDPAPRPDACGSRESDGKII
jgi:hypothetical protein